MAIIHAAFTAADLSLLCSIESSLHFRNHSSLSQVFFRPAGKLFEFIKSRTAHETMIHDKAMQLLFCTEVF